MAEPYISHDCATCDGINYWELANNFSWESDYNMSTFTRNMAARMIQRKYRSYQTTSMVQKRMNSNICTDFKISRRRLNGK